MSYLEEFRLLIEQDKLAPFLRLWEEYCMADQVDTKELKKILLLIKNSNIAKTFGQISETIIPLWKKIDNQEEADTIFTLIIDLQTKNSPFFADLAVDLLTRRFGNQKNFNEKMRIVGLRARELFQGAISNFILLNHMEKGSFVFHHGGWGVGEVMDVSLLREHVLLEFEGNAALKDLSFENAFKNLVPLPQDHFLARRFGSPDSLEEEGKEDPGALVRLLLRDLGPKNAQEIKDELAELVIPEKDWAKWWQAARTKIKKDTKIKSPKTPKDSYELRDEEVSHESRLRELLKQTKNIDAQIQLIYNFSRDFSEILKNSALMNDLKSLLEGREEEPHLADLNKARKIQIAFLLGEAFPVEFNAQAKKLIENLTPIEPILNLIDIVAFKKRLLTFIREVRSDWISIFLNLLFPLHQNTLRDYIFRELEADPKAKELLNEKITELLNKMTLYPEAFLWYFQKIVNQEEISFKDPDSQYLFLEAYFILLHFIEDKPDYREMVKKMQQLVLAKRFEMIRRLIDKASVSFLQEFLLLASKCQCFSKQDLRILHNLAEVVQPSLAKKKEKSAEENNVIWTTSEGYQKLQERINLIGNVETIDNAREIEAARALGDLRENAEYKFALERRARLQAELRTLTQQLNKARILTKEDIIPGEIGVGTLVELVDSKGKPHRYKILGPWEADAEHNILSFQSKLAQAMIGCKAGDTFEFQGETYRVESIQSYFNEAKV